MRTAIKVILFAKKWTPLSLFKFGAEGAWYDLSDINTLYQDSTGTTHVTAVGNPIGRLSDKSGRGNHAIQSTSTARPVYNTFNSTLGFELTTAYRLKHDFVDDKLLWPGSTGDYWIAVCNISGIQFYQTKLTNTTGSIPISDCCGMIILDRAFTDYEKSLITNWFTVRLGGLPTPGWRFECNGANYIGRGGTATSGIEWKFGSGTTKTTMFTDTITITPRESLKFNNETVIGLTHFYTYSNQLTGSIPSLPANLVDAYFYSNQLTGSIPSLPASLTNIYINSNQLTGFIPNLPASLVTFGASFNQLTGSIPNLPASLNYVNFYSNQLIGSIPSLPASLITAYFDYNQLTGSIPSLPASLVNFGIRFNQLTGSIPSLPVSLVNVYFSANQLTGSIPSLPTNLVDAYFDSNQLTGSIPSLPTSLNYAYFDSNQLTGSIPNLPASLITAYFSTNQLTGWSGTTVGALLGNFEAQNNLLTQTTVDALLNAFDVAGKSSGTRILNLDGTGNAAPSAAGLVSKANLVAKGWTVLTN